MQGYNQRNIQQAKLAAQRIYKRVNFDGVNLQSYELNSLMQQTYDYLKIPFNPTTTDVKEYSKVLDANGDGAVTLADLEALAVQYLCGDGVLSGLNTSKASGGAFNQSNYSGSSLPNKASNDYLNYSSSQNVQRTSGGEKQQAAKNYGSYGSGSSFNEQPYTSKSGYSASGTGNYQYQGVSSHSISSQGVNPYTNPGNLYGSSYGASNITQTKQQTQNRQVNQTGPSLVEQPRSKYTSMAQNYLSITRGLFKKYCNPKTNTITREKVSSLLNQTYGALGRKDYYPSQQDVNVWMKLCDTNGDGHVEEAEYEYFVVRALERSGVKVNA